VTETVQIAFSLISAGVSHSVRDHAGTRHQKSGSERVAPPERKPKRSRLFAGLHWCPPALAVTRGPRVGGRTCSALYFRLRHDT
jgi:hypothetical protein